LLHGQLYQPRFDTVVDPLVGCHPDDCVRQVRVLFAGTMAEVRPLVAHHSKRRQQLLLVASPSHHPARPCLRFLPQVLIGGFDDPLHDVAPQSVQFLPQPFFKVAVADLSRDDIYDDLHELQVSLT